jgi:hypothetical protein
MTQKPVGALALSLVAPIAELARKEFIERARSAARKNQRVVYRQARERVAITACGDEPQKCGDPREQGKLRRAPKNPMSVAGSSA